MVKKLRYYARFIVVCLLLKRMKIVRDLVRVSVSFIFRITSILFAKINFISHQELAKQIDDYTITYDPDDQLEWSLVLNEIKTFIEVSPLVFALHLSIIYCKESLC